MFRRLKEKIERALERREAERTPTRDDIDDLLHRMREQVIEMRARVNKMNAEAKRLDERATRMIRHADGARSKAESARDAGRDEEARSALSTAERALRGAEDLRGQAREMKEEARKLELEANEGMEKLKDAERNRDVLLARGRRAGTARRLEEMLRGPESGLQRFERAEEDIETAEDMLEATEEVEEALGGQGRVSADSEYELRQLEASETEGDIDRRLEELKRQIDQEP